MSGDWQPLSGTSMGDVAGLNPRDCSVLRRFSLRARASARRAGGWLRTDWLITVLFCVGAMLRLAATVADYPALLYIDSYDYIIRAYTLNPVGNDPLGYSIFLRIMLAFANLSTVVVIQHLFGLAMGAAIYALLRRYGVRRMLAAAAAAPVLLDAYQIQLEQNILSDTLYETLIVFGITILAWRRRPPLWAFPVGALLLGMTVPVRTIGEVLLLAVLLYPLVVTRGRGNKALSVLLALAGFAVPIVCYADYYYAVTGTPGISGQAYKNLYGRAAMVADCARLPLTAQEQVLCPAQPLPDRYGIDYYINAPDSPLMQQVYRAEAGLPHINIPQATEGFVDVVLMYEPGAFAHSAFDDFVHSFSAQNHVSAWDVPASRWQFQIAYPVYPPGFTLQTATLVDRLGGQGPVRVHPTLLGILRDYQFHGGAMPGPLLGLAALLGVACCCAWSDRVRSSGLRPVCILVTLSGLIPLAVSDLFEYTVRYQLPTIVVLPAAGALGLTALWWPPPVPAGALPSPAVRRDPVGGSREHSGEGRSQG